MSRVNKFVIDMPDLRLVIAQVLAGVTLALVLTNIIVGPEVMMARLAAAFGTIQIGDLGTTLILVLSAAAFVLSLKRRSFLVAGLLVASGVIFLMSPMRAMEHFQSTGAMGVVHVGSFGLAVLGLGVAKGVGTTRTASKHNQTKFLVLMCLTITLIVTFALFSHPGLAGAQNKTLAQSTGIKGMGTNATNIKIVLVHGAWSGASSWSKVIPILQNAGHKVIAVQLALHSLADDIATVKRAIDLLGGPTILVGHSYGGMVITNAAYNNSKVVGLVYLRAFAPQEGQSISSFIDFAKYPKGSLIIDNRGFAYLNSTLFQARDIDPAQAKIAAAVQTPINMSILIEKSGPPAWKQLPTWYQVSEDDRIFPPTLQHLFAKQMNATTISVPYHLPLVSHPNEIAQFILNATKGVTRFSTLKDINNR